MALVDFFALRDQPLEIPPLVYYLRSMFRNLVAFVSKRILKFILFNFRLVQLVLNFLVNVVNLLLKYLKLVLLVFFNLGVAGAQFPK